MALDNVRFGKLRSFRLFQDQDKSIRSMVAKNPEKYDSESHFIRVAVYKLIRFEETIKCQ